MIAHIKAKTGHGKYTNSQRKVKQNFNTASTFPNPSILITVFITVANEGQFR